MAGFREQLEQLFPRRHKSLRFRVLNPVRYSIDNLRLTLQHSRRGDTNKCRIVIISDGEVATSEEQLHPFSLYRTELRRDLKVITMHLLLEDAMRLPKAAFRTFDVFALKLSFRKDAAEVTEVVQTVATVAGNRPLIYLDGDDDICIMHPQILSWVDAYVKKHVFRDRAQYLRRFVGKSNLTDFVHQQYDYAFADDPYARETLPVDIAYHHKIIAGWNVALDSNIASLYSDISSRLDVGSKNVDVMFRGNVPKDWLHFLRKDVEPCLEKLKVTYNVIIPKNRVSRAEYYREMLDSKICVSPFGYGEICWRDFEAVLCGCLLIKPDMGHIETIPNIFKRNETYVSVRWDYADLEEKCSYYLHHEDKRTRIASAAFEVVKEYYGKKQFLSAVSSILSLCNRKVILDE